MILRFVVKPEFVSAGPGRCYCIALRHPAVRRWLEGRDAGQEERSWWRRWFVGREARETRLRARVWREGEVIGRDVGSVPEVEKGEGGACCYSEEAVYFALPENEDPRTAQGTTVIEIWQDGPGPEGGMREKAGPVCILGPQRCGSTALLWALHHATPFKAPITLTDTPATLLEGYYLREILQGPALERALTPFGALAPRNISTQPGGLRLGGYPTGMFASGGLESLVLEDLAAHVERAYATSADAPGRWVDKSPGWESVITAPLFSALFPRGRVIFLSRGPAACIESMLRLEGRNMPDTPDQKSVDFLTMTTAAWLVTHWVWRRVCAPNLRAGVGMHLHFEDLRRDPEAVTGELARFLDLSGFARAGMRRALAGAPVKSTPENSGPTWWRTLVRWFARGEYEKAGRMVGEGAQPEYEVADAVRISALRGVRHFGVQYLCALGMERAHALRAAKSMLPPMPEGAPADEFSGVESMADEPDAPAVTRPAPLLRCMLQSPATGWGEGTESASPAGDPLRTPRHQAFQIHEGAITSRREAAGEFLFLIDGKRYPWKARIRTIRRGRVIADFTSNQSKGTLDVVVRKGRFTGYADLSNRLDLVEGEISGRHVRFTRFIMSS